MPVPDLQSLIRPLLAFGADGGEMNITDAINSLADQMHLTDEERHQTVRTGPEPLFSNRVQWAGTYLNKAGAIRRTRRAHFEITERGRRLLLENLDRIDVSVLRQFPEFIAFQTPRAGANEGDHLASNQASPEIQESPVTPEEAIQHAETQILERLKSEILGRIGELSPALLEGLVVDLIVKMGYGGSRESVVQRLGRSGDQGIDGIINEDPLGLDVIHVQAKRYAADHTVGRDDIQQFAGALAGRMASRGVFVTTSTFTRGAKEYAASITQRIILIDRNELARLMVQYGVGVQTVRMVELKRMDSDYFGE